MSEQYIAIPGTGADGLRIPVGTETPAVDAATGWPSVASSSHVLDLLKWVFSFPAMLATFLAGATFYCGRAFVVDPDLWWHIKTGQTIIATHHWPTTDPYSFTVAGQPWIAFEWLGDILIATVSRIGGVRGLDILLIVLGSAVILALYLLGTIRSGNSKAGFVAAAMLCPLAFPSFTLRSQMLGYLFLVVTLIALELFRQGRKWAVWMLPPLLLVWVNTHGSWIVGLGAIFVYWVCGLMEFRKGGIEAKRWSPAERRSISFVFLLSLIGVTITPYGGDLAVFPFSVASSLPASVANILEWLPMPFNQAGGKIFLALVLGFFVLQMAFNFAWRLEELLLFLGGVVMACLHVRFILLFVPFFAPLLATILSRWLPAYSRAKDKYALNAILMAGVVVAMVHYFPSQADLEQKVANNFPVKAVEYLRQHPVPGPMFDSYGFGGYLIWSLGPEQKVFIDGRSEIYERGGVLNDYIQLTHLKPGGLSILQRYQVQSCLLERDEPLAIVLAALPDWRNVYSDTTSTLFVRRNTASAAVSRPVEQAPARGE
jgi:hypothetical protein